MPTEPILLEAGVAMAPDHLAERLVELGYARIDVVEHRGEFAVRGGIVDLFPSTARRPVRLEFWGDDVESLREFSASTQLSIGKAATVEVYPCRELLVSQEVRRLADEAIPRYRGQFAGLLERLASGLAFEGMEQAIPLLFDHLPLRGRPAAWRRVGGGGRRGPGRGPGLPDRR